VRENPAVPARVDDTQATRPNRQGSKLVIEQLPASPAPRGNPAGVQRCAAARGARPPVPPLRRRPPSGAAPRVAHAGAAGGAKVQSRASARARLPVRGGRGRQSRDAVPAAASSRRLATEQASPAERADEQETQYAISPVLIAAASCRPARAGYLPRASHPAPLRDAAAAVPPARPLTAKSGPTSAENFHSLAEDLRSGASRARRPARRGGNAAARAANPTAASRQSAASREQRRIHRRVTFATGTDAPLPPPTRQDLASSRFSPRHARGGQQRNAR
jgi:hypothetical protein